MFGSIVEPNKWTPRRLVSVLIVSIFTILGGLAWTVQDIMASEVPPPPPTTSVFVHVVSLMPPTPPLPKRHTEAKKTELPMRAIPTEPNNGINPEPPERPTEPDAPEGPGNVPGGGNDVFEKPNLEPPPPAPPSAPVRVGGNIKPPEKIRDVRPVYPQIAQAARVQGIVIIEATIGADGAVENAKVLSANSLLDGAALDAVRQWMFTPTLLNGMPVPVVMTVTVRFNLQ